MTVEHLVRLNQVELNELRLKAQAFADAEKKPEALQDLVCYVEGLATQAYNIALNGQAGPK